MRLLVAIPAYNEEAVLRRSVETVVAFCAAAFPRDTVTVVIADNASTDGTAAVAADLAAASAAAGAGPKVMHLRLPRRGKGFAVREAWRSAEADIYAFMDADLATDLSALPPAVAAVQDGAGLALGSRYVRGARVRRGPFRKLLSYGYRTLLGLALGSDITDAPCGFKVASAEVVAAVMPNVGDDGWFFDSELALRAERGGFRIAEVPVAWADGGPTRRRSGVAVARVTADYVRSVWRLRRELGPKPASAPVSVVTRGEWRTVAAVAAAAALVCALPPLVTWYVGRQHGLEWSGRSFLSPGDTGVYLSYIRQAMAGRLAFDNVFTTEALVPVPNVLWLLVGWLGALLHATPIAAYHLARTLLIFPLAAVAYAFFSRLFSARRHRLLALAVFLFGGGLGLPASALLRPACDASGCAWPTDLWVSESQAFLSMLYSPHFVASWTLLLLALLLLLDACDRSSVRRGALAGVAALALLQFHPFHVITLYVVGGVALLVRAAADGYRPRQWAAYALFLLVSLPSPLYFFWLTHFTPNGRFMFGNNITLTPALPYVLLGFGAVGIGAVIGWLIERFGVGERLLQPRHRAFLAAWAITQSLLVYAPFTLQRRLLEGLAFPLAALAVPAMVAAARRFRLSASFAVLAFVALLLPSSFAAIAQSLPSRGAAPALAFFAPETSAALAWIRDSTAPDAVVLSLPDDGNTIGGWTGRHVYVGHWANTVGIEEKSAAVAAFYAPTASAASRASFIAANGIDIVWVDTSAEGVAGFVPEPSWNAAFSAGTITLYRVR